MRPITDQNLINELNQKAGMSEKEPVPVNDQSLIDELNKKSQFSQATGVGDGNQSLTSRLMADIAGGLLSGVSTVPKLAASIGGENLPFQGAVKSIKEFDPYKAMGTEDKPLMSGEGLVQGISELLTPMPLLEKPLKYLNPMKLSSKNIAKDILAGEKKAIEKFSGEKGLYNELSREASERGIKKVNIKPEDININDIKKYSSEKATASLDKFLEDKSLTNAQKAISDLGHTQRRLEGKVTLNSEEKAQLKAVKNAKNKIQENMFKDSKGKIHQDLLDKHKEIQKGYAKEVIPYTKNKPIQAHKKGELVASELIPKVSKGKFRALRESEHPSLATRRLMKEYKVPAIAASAGLGAGGLAKTLYDLLSGKE